MLCDRAEDAFDRLPTEAAFQQHIRAHFWDERSGAGGWQNDSLLCFLRRNRFYADPPG